MNGLLAGYKLRLAALNYREDAVFEYVEKWRGLVRAVLRSIARVLLTRKNVAGVGERRNPPSIVQPCIPNNVIDMKVRAHHDVHILGLAIRSTKAIQVRIV